MIMNIEEIVAFESIKNVIEAYDDSMQDYLYVYDYEEDHYYIGKSAAKRFAMPTNEFHNVLETHGLFVHPADLGGLLNDLSDIRDGKKDAHNLRYRWIGKDGSPIWINCKGRTIKDTDGKTRYLIGCINEIGKHSVADNDSGLLTEAAVKDKLSEIDFEPKNCYFLELSIDKIEELKQKYGKDYAARLEKVLANCVQASLVNGQYAFKLNNGNVLVFDTLKNTESGIKGLYNTIRHGIDSFIKKDKYDSLYTISAGALRISDCPDYEGDTLQSYIHFAVNEAKRRGSNRVYFFDMCDYEKELANKELVHEMRAAISNGYDGFDMHFQPVVNRFDENLNGAEALLRYTAKDGRVVSPLDFIPLLEESGLIIPVGKWVLKKALSMASECRKIDPDFRVSVNVSYIQLLKSPLFDEIMSALMEANLPPDALIVELTESGYLDNTEAVRSVWRKLRNQGVLIAIDDFGTGYSNLITIGKLKPQIVKIDRSFATKALENEYEFNLLVHIIQMVHSLDLELVIEGIETAEELDRVQSLKPDYIQGYYYSKPIGRPEFINYLNSKIG